MHPFLEPAFGNVEYRVQFTMSTTKDKRIMSFVDTLWGFEVTGGYDQYEPLTVLAVSDGMQNFYYFSVCVSDFYFEIKKKMRLNKLANEKRKI